MGNPRKGTDVSRAERKAKKRKLEDAIPDLPGDDVQEGNDVVESSSNVEKKKSSKRKREEDVEENGIAVEKEVKKKSKKAKKDKSTEDADAGEGAVAQEKKDKKKKKKDSAAKDTETNGAQTEDALEGTENGVVAVEGADEPRKSKKERKAERKAKEAAEKAAAVATSIDAVTETNGEETTAKAEEKKSKNNRNREKKRKAASGEAGEDATSAKASRFIVFVGNLPFSATTESITKHFAAVHPKSVRHLTQKDNPAKSKGCAFVEFEGYDHMKTCLKLMHHSQFDDGVSAPRKINVELTAGGGGNTKDRKAKIQEKNLKLNEQRSRRIQEEAKAKLVKQEGAIDESAIHPSRRTRVPGAQ